MKNELILKIEERYADMRTSEQKVADISWIIWMRFRRCH